MVENPGFPPVEVGSDHLLSTKGGYPLLLTKKMKIYFIITVIWTPISNIPGGNSETHDVPMMYKFRSGDRKRCVSKEIEKCLPPVILMLGHRL